MNKTEREKARKRAAYLANGDEMRAKARDYYHNHRARVRECQNAYYARTKAEQHIKRKAYRDNNKDRIRAERRRVNTRYSRAKSGAKYFGRSWNIPLSVYRELMSSPCFYCKVSIASESGSGLDRINNALGYEVDNVLTCCAVCNRLRMNVFTVEETQQLGALKAALFAARQMDEEEAEAA
jgi:hypothetical protein